jgi:H+/Cl- antiporter ClcA
MDTHSLLSQKQLSYILFALVGSIFVAHMIAQANYLYWTIWWFDMPMHFAGGVFLGFFVLYIRFFIFKYKDFSQKYRWVGMLLLWVLFISIGWELYEFCIDHNFSTRLPNYLDTASDLCFDMAGGCISILFLIKKRLL